MVTSINTKPMNTPINELRLLQLVSSGLPIGSFTYSQGLEWAVETGWVQSKSDLQAWLADTLQCCIAHLEVPVFLRLYSAYSKKDYDAADSWVDYLLASRETSELKIEEQQRGRAFARLLPALDLVLDEEVISTLKNSQLAGFAFVAAHWGIDPLTSGRAYVWSWLENLSLAGVKLIPLGQTAGQEIIFELGENITQALRLGQTLEDDELGFACCAQAIASSHHESQYTRLYRS